MIKLTIENNTFTNIPENYSEMTVRQLIRYTEARENDSDLIGLVSGVIGCDRELLENLYLEDVNALLSEFQWLTTLPGTKMNTTIEVGGVTYVSKKNHLLTWGEQVSIETFLKEDKNNIKSFALVLAILYRPGLQDENGEWQQNPLEKDIDVIIERAELFLDGVTVEQVYGVLHFFSNGGAGHTTPTSPRFSLQKEGRKTSSGNE